MADVGDAQDGGSCMMPFLRTSNLIARRGRPPNSNVVLNQDSWQKDHLSVVLPFTLVRDFDASQFHRHPNDSISNTKLIPAKLGKMGADFPGSGHRIGWTATAAAFLRVQTFTRSMWIEWSGDNSAFIKKQVWDVGGRADISIGNNTVSAPAGRLDGVWYDGSVFQFLTFATTVPTSGISHLVFVIDQKKSQVVYLNGKRIASSALTKDIVYAIGRDSHIGNPSWTTSLNTALMRVIEARQYDVAFTDDQVFELYNPYTRWDLYHELGRTVYFFPAAAPSGSSIPVISSDYRMRRSA